MEIDTQIKNEAKTLITTLRQKAEEQFANTKSQTTNTISEVDLLKLIHELEVHQIELEMQNEELRCAKERAECAEAKYTELYDFEPSGYLSVNENGEILNLNLSAAQMLGKARMHLVNSIFGFFIDNASLSIFNNFLEKAFASFIKESCTIILHNKSYVQLTGIVCKHGSHCFITMTDITEMKRTEEKLIESEERFKRITNGLTDYLYTVKMNNGIVTETIHDESCLKVTGYSSLDFLKDPFLWLTMIVAEDKKLVLDRIAKIAEGGEINPIEHRIICKNGSIRWINNIIIPKYNNAGELISYEGVIKDITDRKQTELTLHESEIKFKEIISQINDGIIVYDEQGKIVIWNHGAETIFGIKEEEALASTIVDIQYQLAPPNMKDKALIKKTIKDIITGKTPDIFNKIIDNETMINSQEIRNIQSIVFPVSFSNHNLYCSVLRDTTEMKQYEKQLIQLNADKDRFISILAHDLSSPFNSILGFLDLLTDNIRTDDIDTIERQLHIVNNSAKHFFSLLQDILLWVRAQSGKLPFEPKECNLAEICEDAVSNYTLNIEHKNISISYLSLDNLNMVADIDMIKTVFRNLISNAIKFTNKGGDITISAQQNQSALTVSITDNGIGISPERIAKLFSISEIHSTNGTANEKGTGLGLLLCKEFITKHGGTIWVESELGNGTSFIFTVPLRNV